MKPIYRIGKNKINDIVFSDIACAEFHAEIQFKKGIWIINNLNNEYSTYINNRPLKTSNILNKYDKIKIGNETKFWSDYLYEGLNQELHLKDFYSIHGRISQANYRAISILFLGLSICLYFVPGIIAMFCKYYTEKYSDAHINEINLTKDLVKYIYPIGFTFILLLFMNMSIKRIRDTGKSIGTLFIPFYNLKILFFEKSKRPKHF